MIQPIIQSNMPRLFKWAFAFMVGMVMLIGLVSVASADDVYRSDHIDFHPVGNQPLRSGFVENIHSDGPQLYAIERYVLNGAAPNTLYYIKPLLYLVDAGCTEGLVPFPIENSISTNGAGNGTTLVTIPPEVAAGLDGLTINGRWQLLVGAPDGPVAYESDCAVIVLD